MPSVLGPYRVLKISQTTITIEKDGIENTSNIDGTTPAPVKDVQDSKGLQDLAEAGSPKDLVKTTSPNAPVRTKNAQNQYG